MQDPNVDSAEVQKFDSVASGWWDPAGDMAALHHINPVRLEYILSHTSISTKKTLDVGCGAGLLSESMAKAGAIVTAIDASEKAIQVAGLHALESGVGIDYQLIRSEQLAETGVQYDVITCMEMLEHVPDPELVIADIAKLLKPGGKAFISTINRTAKAYALAVFGAEYILNIVPKGTHEYARFIKPSELASMGRSYGLSLIDTKGMGYNPLSKTAWLEDRPDVNYLMAFSKS